MPRRRRVTGGTAAVSVTAGVVVSVGVCLCAGRAGMVAVAQPMIVIGHSCRSFVRSGLLRVKRPKAAGREVRYSPGVYVSNSGGADGAPAKPRGARQADARGLALLARAHGRSRRAPRQRVSNRPKLIAMTVS